MSVVPPLARQWLDEGLADPEAFWARAAAEVPWFRRWDRVFEADYPTFRWFAGGETNLAYNAVDHQVATGRGEHVALRYLNERGDERSVTYRQLLAEVTRASAALRALGIGRGDRVTLYMPTCVEAIVTMLAAVRIGAIHSVVFAGFGARALSDRIVASGSMRRLHRRLHLPQGQAGAAQADRGRRAGCGGARGPPRGRAGTHAGRRRSLPGGPRSDLG